MSSNLYEKVGSYLARLFHTNLMTSNSESLDQKQKNNQCFLWEANYLARLSHANLMTSNSESLDQKTKKINSAILWLDKTLDLRPKTTASVILFCIARK